MSSKGTPEATVTAYLEALKTRDWDRATACFDGNDLNQWKNSVVQAIQMRFDALQIDDTEKIVKGSPDLEALIETPARLAYARFLEASIPADMDLSRFEIDAVEIEEDEATVSYRDPSGSSSPGAVQLDLRDVEWCIRLPDLGRRLVEAQGDELERFSNAKRADDTAGVRWQDLFPICEDSKWGYMDRTGKVRIQPRFSRAWPFREGRAAVRVLSSYGYIDEKGSFAVAPRFSQARDYSASGFAVAARSAGFLEQRWGIIDRTGRFVVEPIYDDVRPLRSHPWVIAQANEKFRVLDMQGNALSEWTEYPVEAVEQAAGGGHMYNEDHRILLPLLEDGQLPNASLTGVGPHLVYDVDRHGVASVDEQLNPIGDAYPQTGVWSEGLLAVATAIEDDDDDEADDGEEPELVLRWGFIDAAGRQVVAPTYDAVGPFVDGRARVIKGQKTAYIDSIGHVVIPFSSDHLEDFERGLCRIGFDEAVGYIDTDGHTVRELKD